MSIAISYPPISTQVAQPRKDGGRDRRRALEADAADPLDKAIVQVMTSRWITSAGLADTTADHPLLDAIFLKLSDGSMGCPCSRTVGASSPTAELEEQLMIKNMRDELSLLKKFYSNQPFLHLVADCWTSRSKYPFLGLDYHCAKPIFDPTRTKDLRCARTAGLVHLPGPHNGHNIAVATADHFDELLSIPIADIEIPSDNYSNTTDISATFLSFTSDSGGGVHASARRLGLRHESCRLHDLDLVLSGAEVERVPSIPTSTDI